MTRKKQRLHISMQNCTERSSGADPGFDQGGAPDRDRPKTAILGPQFCRILVLGPHFWWSGGGPGPRGPPWIRPWVFHLPWMHRDARVWRLLG